MSQVFDSLRDGAAGMVEPARMRAGQALASITAGQPGASRWTAGAAGGRVPNR